MEPLLRYYFSCLCSSQAIYCDLIYFASCLDKPEGLSFTMSSMAEIAMVLGIKKKITLNFLLGFLLSSFFFFLKNLFLFSMISDDRVKNDGEMQ